MISLTPCAKQAQGVCVIEHRSKSRTPKSPDVKRRRNAFWTGEQLESLRVLAGKGVTANSLAVRFGRSKKAVLDKAKELQLSVRVQSRLPSRERVSWLGS
jgi:hypothetical protein